MDSMYPRVLTETGLLGLVAFFVLCGSLFRMGTTSYRNATDQFSRGIALGFLLGLVGLLVHAVGANTFLIVRIMEPFWLFAALVVRSLLIVQAVEAVKSGIAPQPAADGGEGSKMNRPAMGRPRMTAKIRKL
jgi:O-antigen ligase